MNLRNFVYLAFLHFTPAWALPSIVEVWFLSPPKYSQNFRPTPKQLFVFSEAVHKQCQKMGEHFFHAQLGLHDHVGEVPGVMAQVALTQDEIDKLEKADPARESKYLSNLDVDLVSCDSNYYFDLFCGKAKGKSYSAKANEFELWVDTSSSLNQVDRKDRQGECFRKAFTKSLSAKCPKLEVSVFDTSIKAMGSESTLCDTIGLNDQDRLIKWIQESRAQRLLVITDIYELSTKFSSFLDSIGAKVRGDIPQKELLGSDILRFTAEFQKTCH